jgi:hypothetical protein
MKRDAVMRDAVMRDTIRRDMVKRGQKLSESLDSRSWATLAKWVKIVKTAGVTPISRTCDDYG